MTPAQSKAARAVLRWTVSDLAGRAGMTLHSLSQWEGGSHLNPAELDRLRACFEANGVEIARNGYGITWCEISDEVDQAHARGDTRPRFQRVVSIGDD